jgi:hypothetical protein
MRLVAVPPALCGPSFRLSPRLPRRPGAARRFTHPGRPALCVGSRPGKPAPELHGPWSDLWRGLFQSLSVRVFSHPSPRESKRFRPSHAGFGLGALDFERARNSPPSCAQTLCPADSRPSRHDGTVSLPRPDAESRLGLAERGLASTDSREALGYVMHAAVDGAGAACFNRPLGKVLPMRPRVAREIEMRGHRYGVSVSAAILCVLFVCSGTREAEAQVSISINLGPPPIMVAEPPAVVLVPNSQVYFVPQLNFDVFFYNGWWWSPRGDRWYRARAYNGPWGIVERRYVPAPVFRVPRDYRTRYGNQRPIPYGQWKKDYRRRAEHGGYGYGSQGYRNQGHGSQGYRSQGHGDHGHGDHGHGDHGHGNPSYGSQGHGSQIYGPQGHGHGDHGHGDHGQNN